MPSTSGLLSSAFPWANAPLVCNAPMAGVASPTLAAEVTRVGGLGFLGCSIDIGPESSELDGLHQKLEQVKQHLGSAPDDVLPIGIGYLTCHSSISHFAATSLPIIKKHRPAAVWLFGPGEGEKSHKGIIADLRTLQSRPLVFVQVGNVAAATEAVEDGADVLVCQGIDAGGHQYRQGTGVVTLVLEVRRMLERDFASKSVSVVAAGGLADGKGVAAMMALGADGVVMGTRFTVASESAYAAERKKLILATKDGGVNTLKLSSFNDEVTRSSIWGPSADGRAIVGPVHKAFLAGTSLSDCQDRVEADAKAGLSPPQINTWAGAAVGLVNREQGAAEIVEEVRAEALQTMRGLARFASEEF